jgi:serine/threonine protein kinase
MRCPVCATEIEIRSDSKEEGDVFDEQMKVAGKTLPTLPQEVPPGEDEGIAKVYSYQVLRLIAEGGMGKVYLAYDHRCGRYIALKKIRPDLKNPEKLAERFLHEARITAQLIHPAVIPIYNIHLEKGRLFYTMPYIQGATLKEILKGGEGLDTAIPALLRIFLSVCQAIAFAHVSGVIHRDLKPENIIVGTYGQIVILDWGLAKIMGEIEDLPDMEAVSHDLTLPGKVVGTVQFMAPEIAKGGGSTIQSDIYALGVILYQILTLKFPFQRRSLKEFRDKVDREQLEDPLLAAPYRDIPPILARIAMKSLSPNPEQRYQSVDQMIKEIESYLEGRSDWFEMARLNLSDRYDWEFQANVLLSQHIALTRHHQWTDWVSLMISRQSFGGNVKLTTRVQLGEKSQGIGFLLNIPEGGQRHHLDEGYCIWLGTERVPETKVIRSGITVVEHPRVVLPTSTLIEITIEKIGEHLTVHINGEQQFIYISHTPLSGTHVGLISLDADFQIEPIRVMVGSLSLTVGCLEIPNAFLAYKDYRKALDEYRRIAYSFPGRTEGREALFRAGVTLLEMAKSSKERGMADLLFEEAFQEFEKLRKTPSAPLEYLGKSLVYRAQNDFENEVNSLEIGYRRYRNHPLIEPITEQILYRLHAASGKDEKTTYRYLVFVLHFLPEKMTMQPFDRLLKYVKEDVEKVPFLLGGEEYNTLQIGIALAFWLHRSEFIENYLPNLHTDSLIAGAAFALAEMGEEERAKELIERIQDPHNQRLLHSVLVESEIDLDRAIEQALDSILVPYSPIDLAGLAALCDCAIRKKRYELVHRITSKLDRSRISARESDFFDQFSIEAYLYEGNITGAGMVLQNYSYETLNLESSPLHPYYGCWLLATEGKTIAHIHFSGIWEVHTPKIPSLLGLYVTKMIAVGDSWWNGAFVWEKRQFCRQARLYHTVKKNYEQAERYRTIEEELIHEKDTTT